MVEIVKYEIKRNLIAWVLNKIAAFGTRIYVTEIAPKPIND